jgi:hypothetical protein
MGIDDGTMFGNASIGFNRQSRAGAESHQQFLLAMGIDVVNASASSAASIPLNHMVERTEFTTYGVRTRQRPHVSVAQPHATEPRAPARQLVLICLSAPVDWLPCNPASGLSSTLRSTSTPRPVGSREIASSCRLAGIHLAALLTSCVRFM